jgi:excisionase family DNA binding protein
VIAAPSPGVLLTVDEARVVLRMVRAQELLLVELAQAQQRRPQPLPADIRIVGLNLRRAVARVGASEPVSARIATSATRSATNGRFKSEGAHHPSYATYSSAEAAQALGITANAVRARRIRGRLRAERVGGRWRFDAAEVDRQALNRN